MFKKLTMVLLTSAAALPLLLNSADAGLIYWSSRFHSGDITADTPSHAHDAAGYVAAWNAIAGNPPTAGYGDSSFNDWTNVNNQSAIPSGSSSNYGLHAHFSFNVPANDTGSWTFNVGNDAGYGGVLLIDGSQVAINPNNYYPNGPSGSVVLGAGFHSFDVYSFEDCCDGPATSTFLDPLHVGGNPLAINDTNLQLVPEPASLLLFGLGAIGIFAIRCRRRV